MENGVLFQPDAYTRKQEEAPRFVLPEGWRPEVLPPAVEQPRMVVNEERIDEVLSILLQAYDSKDYPYSQNHVRLPHDPEHMPSNLEYGSVDHAMFLWTSCYYMRGGIKSVDAFKRLSRIYESRPDLFQCNVAMETSQDVIIKELEQAGLGFQETVASQWVENAARLHRRYDGDPRKIFDNVSSYEESLAAIRNDGKGDGFIGFREKMVSMIIYYLMDENLIEPFTFPIPVDLHVMRVSIANRLIEFPDAPHGTNLYSDEMLAMLREIYFNYCVSQGVDPLRLCDAVWLLSESSCGKHPGNVTLEPFGRENRSGRTTVLLPGAVDTSSPKQQAAYDSSCRRCPLEDTCELNIPGKHYYVGGSVIIRGKRVRFPHLPQMSLLPADD